jgi:hypothetical protein
MTTEIAPRIGEYLQDLEVAVGQLSDLWRPNDTNYKADFYRQIMMNLSYSYFAFFHADAEHPDWAPLWNPVYADQPNPDDIYLWAPIRGDLTYRVSGDRGTCALLTFNTQKGFVGRVDDTSKNGFAQDFDHRSLEVGPNGELEIIFSVTRPEGYAGNWAPIAPEADSLMVRYRSVDWVNERDPHLSIECLDPVPPKARLQPDEIVARIKEMAKLPWRYNKAMLRLQNEVKANVGVNTFVPRKYGAGALSIQCYWPAVFELEDDEALIIETELPDVRPYWNIQLNDPYFNAIEIVYRFSSINSATAKVSSDGKLRAVISQVDPGVPNWLDPAGFKEGTIYGRWYDCDSEPMPVIKRVPLAELAKHLPADTPVVTPQERASALRERVRAAQRRRRW